MNRRLAKKVAKNQERYSKTQRRAARRRLWRYFRERLALRFFCYPTLALPVQQKFKVDFSFGTTVPADALRVGTQIRVTLFGRYNHAVAIE